MRNLRKIAVLCAAVLIIGCIPSIHPLYTEADLIFEPALVGMWAEEDEDDRWIFRKSSRLEYELTITEDGVPGDFEARLLQLGSHRFLDLYPEEPPIDNGFYTYHLMPIHTFYKFQMEGDTVRIVALDVDWLGDKIEAGEITLDHEYIDDTLVLTASTEDLQATVLKYADDPEAFCSGPDAAVAELHRQ